MSSALSRAFTVLSFVVAMPLGCGSGTSNPPTTKEDPEPKLGSAEWYAKVTASHHLDVPVPSSGAAFDLAKLKEQITAYDPGSVLRCELADDDAFRQAVDAAGGVQWGYGVSILEDQSQPVFRKGKHEPYRMYPGATNDAAGKSAEPVEIAKPDIVGLTTEAALYYTPGHGIIVVDLTGQTPALRCGAKLPGQVEKFFFYKGHLVAMIENWVYGAGHHAFLFHFQLTGTTLGFVESVDLGNVHILDSRRFNAELVIYGSLSIDTSPTTSTGGGTGGDSPLPSSGRFASTPTSEHRTLRVFHIGSTLEPKMNDTLLDGRKSQDQLASQVDASTAIGTEVSRWQNFDAAMWASDHYFAITQSVSRTMLEGWVTQNYTVCTKSHTVPHPYRSCTTKYETRPNPDYVVPDNNGGDRACKGATLRDCLRTVVRISSPTIEVPVGITCVDATYDEWVCDAQEWRSTTYPTFRTENSTKLFIYEYTDGGFVRLADQAVQLDATALGTTSGDATVTKLTFSKTPAELLLQGRLQTLQFQNGYLYAISDGELRTFAIEGGSLMQTSQVKGTSNTLQTSLFTDNRLYLSDYSWGSYSSGPTSVLRVFDLSNAAFPVQASQDLSLPGGHDAIMPIDAGILTIGSVERFEGQNGPWLKLGLFTDPFAAEKSYLILGTDLTGPRASVNSDVTYYLDGATSRLFLPYSGYDAQNAAHLVARVGISHVANDTIVTEGALDMPETPERVRPIPGRDNQLLTFAPNSIHWVTPAGKDWQATPVFAYFRPMALYHPAQGDVYFELSKLGDACKLRFATKSTINQRTTTGESAAFDCMGWGMSAYANNLLLGANGGVRFTLDANNTLTVVALAKDEIATIQAAITARLTCILDPSKADDSAIDWTTTPDLSHMKCFTPAELAVLDQSPTSPTGPSPSPQP